MGLLGSDRQVARRQTIIMAVLSVALAGPAYFLLPWEGLIAHFGAALVGVAVGFLVARLRAHRFEASIRGAWTQWMRHSVASESLPEIHRRVQGKSSRNLPYRFAVVLILAWAIELLLLVVAFRDETSTMLAIPVIAYNGLVAGSMLAYFIHRARWTKEFSGSVKELVESGEIGLWGVL